MRFTFFVQEVIGSGSKRNHDHTKADMYSLGIVFFEMNFSFSTQSERIVVLEQLRRAEVVFPDAWQGRLQQKESKYSSHFFKWRDCLVSSSHSFIASTRCCSPPYCARVIKKRSFTSQSPRRIFQKCTSSDEWGSNDLIIGSMFNN